MFTCRLSGCIRILKKTILHVKVYTEKCP
uniref:Uncharacterized protein n=1 Tax=Anguilla anguilla TaxID=7936 RepID=A0A0E9W838_ANGAN